MKFSSGILVGVRSVGVEFSMDFVLLFLSRFDRLGGVIECVMGHSPYEVGMVTLSESCVNGMFSGSVVSSEIIPDVISVMTHWCVRGAKHIFVGDDVVDDVWVVCFHVVETWSAVSPNIFTNFCSASP